MDPLHREQRWIGSYMPGSHEEIHMRPRFEKGPVRKYQELPRAPLEGAQISGSQTIKKSGYKPIRHLKIHEDIKAGTQGMSI